MREILFRGKRTDNGEWVVGYLYITHNGEYEIGSYSKELNIERFTHCVIPETIGQDTGLTDKNGKRIFEGDIVKDKDLNISSIKIGCCLPSHFYKLFNFKEYDKHNLMVYAVYAEHVSGKHKGEHFLLPEKNSVIVIGNVTDNPELLKGE